jgi:hypothetical protein
MSKSSSPALSRRGMLVGAGVAGAAAVAATAIPRAARPPVAAEAPTPAAPEGGGGYRLSAHVMRYYQTARV